MLELVQPIAAKNKKVNLPLLALVRSKLAPPLAKHISQVKFDGEILLVLVNPNWFPSLMDERDKLKEDLRSLPIRWQQLRLEPSS